MITKVVIDSQTLNTLIKPFIDYKVSGDNFSFKLKEVFIRHNVLSIKCIANRINMKVNFKPLNYSGKLAFKVDSAVSWGIKVEFVEIFSDILKNIKYNITDQFKIVGNYIVSNIDVRYAGILEDELMFEVNL